MNQSPEVENVARGRSPSVTFSIEGHHNFHVPRTTVCHMFCHMTKMVAWEFFVQDGGVSESFGKIAYKMAAMQNKQNVNKNNVEYVLRLQCRIYLVNVT